MNNAPCDTALSSRIARDGYVFVEKFLSEKPTDEVARSLGRFARIEGGTEVHSVRPKLETDAPANTYSGIYGLGKFPLHTDFAHWKVPPRYLMLRCRKGHESVSTNVLDGRTAIASVGHVALQKSLVKPRRRVGGAVSLLRLYEKAADGSDILRWDETFIRPASKAGERGYEKLRAFLDQSSPIQIFLANPGDLLIVDNWRMLHSRSPVPAEMNDREIERAYFSSLMS